MKGILFKPVMIPLIVEGKKTQTRRKLKPQPYIWKGVMRWSPGNEVDINMDDHADLAVPYARYRVGETVYIKEAWRLLRGDGEPNDFGVQYGDGEIRWWRDNGQRLNYAFPFENKNRVSMFMPAWAARHFITITDVRAERLQEITEEEEVAEGCNPTLEPIMLPNKGGQLIEYAKVPYTAKMNFAKLWDSINPKTKWDTNPWCWKYSFKYKESDEKQ